MLQQITFSWEGKQTALPCLISHPPILPSKTQTLKFFRFTFHHSNLLQPTDASTTVDSPRSRMGKPKKVPRRSKSPEHRRHGKRVSSSIAESPTQASQPKKLKSTSSQSSTTTGPEDSSLSTLSTTTVGPEGFSLDMPSATTVDQENPWLTSASGPTVDLSGYLDGIL